MRHQWEKETRDLRRSVLDARPSIHRCRRCKMVRLIYYWETGPETSYWKNNVRSKRAGECG